MHTSSEDPYIEQQIIKGQEAAIRRVRPHYLKELIRLQVIEEDPIKWFVSRSEAYTPLTEAELTAFKSPTNDLLVYAVSGAMGRSDIEELGEVGKLHGLIYINPDSKIRIAQLQAKGLTPSISTPRILEVSYAKLPTALAGQMASGLRQVCVEIARMNASIDTQSNEPTIMINAYVIDDERGLNSESINVLHASGFVERGKIRYDNEASATDRVFTLDWKNLDAKLKLAADPR